LTSALTQDIDLDGNVDVDSIFDLARRPSGHGRGMLVEQSSNGVEVDVNDRVNLYVAVKLKVWVDVEVLVEGPRSNHDRPRRLVLHVLRCYRSQERTAFRRR
jgi:hypothetical protein